ncbi:MAG: sigma-70 family RNA polymerase sigma factor [Planctomycetaceae bacterium]
MELVRAGDHDGWNSLVARFEKRLMAFARQQVDQTATAEDLVQETFIAFLKAMDEFREQCELESFLFRILRRRIVDHYRRQGRNREVPVCAFQGTTADSGDPFQHAAAPDMHASWYARRDEALHRDFGVLAAAIRELAASLQRSEKFRDLKIAEGLFYAGCRNKELADVLRLTENEVAVTRHRLIERLARFVRDAGGSADDHFSDAATTGLLTSVWESQRPTCPKRTTLGKSILGILPPEWADFVRFHVETLGCTFCNANLSELRLNDEAADSSSMRERLFASTVGFLRMKSG